MPVETIKWVGDYNGYVDMIDQTLLPVSYERVAIKDVPAMYDAIKRLVVRGAPAIGIAAGYGAVLGLQKVPDDAEVFEARAQLEKDCVHLAESRPTAVNLSWALNRMLWTAEQSEALTTRELKQRLLREAQAIYDEDAEMCRAMGA